MSAVFGAVVYCARRVQWCAVLHVFVGNDGGGWEVTVLMHRVAAWHCGSWPVSYQASGVSHISSCSRQHACTLVLCRGIDYTSHDVQIGGWLAHLVAWADAVYPAPQLVSSASTSVTPYANGPIAALPANSAQSTDDLPGTTCDGESEVL